MGEAVAKLNRFNNLQKSARAAYLKFYLFSNGSQGNQFKIDQTNYPILIYWLLSISIGVAHMSHDHYVSKFHSSKCLSQSVTILTSSLVQLAVP